MPAELVSFGHGTASADAILALLHAAQVTSLVDVRTAPGSNRHPHVSRDRLQDWLPAGGIAYRWEPRLGGFRRPPPDSPDCYWRNTSFRGYAAHLRQPDARAAVQELVQEAAERRTAAMCSESVWWRCHRRLIADTVVLAYGAPVRHLMHDGRLVAHLPSPGARLLDDRLVVYDLARGGTAAS